MLTKGIRLSSPEFRYIAWIIDFILIFASGIGVYKYYIGLPDAGYLLPNIYTALVFGAGILLGILSESIYRSWRALEIKLLLIAITKTWSIVVVVMALGLFITKTSNEISRIWFVFWALFCWTVMLVERILVYQALRWLRGKGYNYKSVLLIGGGSLGNEVKGIIEASKWAGINIIGEIEAADLEEYLQGKEEKQPNEVWLCISMSQEKELRLALHALRHSTVDIRLVPDIFTLKLVNHGVSNVLGIPMLDLSISPITREMRMFKEVEDKLIALIILLLLTPLMFLIAMGIKLTSRGPIFFVQKRWGWNGKEITVYKFRTMVVHQEDDGCIRQATIHDVRVTSFGSFLRRTSLDELPQFFNVLQGRMSIVGPRPHAVSHNEYYKELIPRYMLRHKVKPGITGWAQVNGYRGETDTVEKMQKRIELDLYYIENMSIFFDLEIIIRTVHAIFFDKNAH